MYGYNRQILRVDLSQGAISAEALDELFCRKYLGGAGFVTYFLDPKQLEKAKSYYYTLMGWDAKTGIPTSEKLQELGIACKPKAF